MSLQSRRLASFVILTLTLHAAASVSAAEVCWVERVTTVDKGVAVYFVDKGGPGSVTVETERNAETGVWLLRAGKLMQCPTHAAQCAFTDEGSVDHLTLPPGSKIFAHNMPEDACTLTVVVDNQRTGLEARIAQHLPGLPAVNQTYFIPVR